MTKQYKNALIIMILCIVVSSAVSGVTGINRLAKVPVDWFYNGEPVVGEHTPLSIYNDLIDKTEFAADLTSLATKYGGLSDSEAHIKQILDLNTKIKGEKSVSKLYKLMVSLDENVTWLVSTLETKNLTAAQKTMLASYKKSYNSKTNTINFDPYNSKVKEYYDQVSGFPASLFRLFSTKVEYFR